MNYHLLLGFYGDFLTQERLIKSLAIGDRIQSPGPLLSLEVGGGEGDGKLQPSNHTLVPLTSPSLGAFQKSFHSHKLSVVESACYEYQHSFITLITQEIPRILGPLFYKWGQKPNIYLLLEITIVHIYLKCAQLFCYKWLAVIC